MTLIADIGVPMIAVFLPAAWLAIVPIILIEAFVGVRVAKLPFRQAAYVAAAANLFSTLLGIPLTWIVLAVVEGAYFSTAQGLGSPLHVLYAVTVQAPWLIPYGSDLAWMIPVASIVLAVPLCLMSIGSEYLIVKLVLRSVPPATLRKWMWKANVASYAFLLVLIFLMSVLGSVGQWAYFLLAPVIDWLIQAVFYLAGAIAKR